MQKQDKADLEAGDKRGLNAILRNLEQSSDETPGGLEVKVNALIADILQQTVVCTSAKRIKRKNAALDHLV